MHAAICRIGLIDGDLPYIVPLNYGFSGNVLYFHSAPAGKKIDLLKQNNRVCFEIEQSNELVRNEQACNWTSRYRCVIGYGTVEIITDRDEKINGLDIIMKHYGNQGNNTYNDANLERMVILKLTIDRISGKQSGDW
jgi:hypothetical protein